MLQRSYIPSLCITGWVDPPPWQSARTGPVLKNIKVYWSHVTWGCTSVRGTLLEAAPVSMGHITWGCICVRGHYLRLHLCWGTLLEAALVSVGHFSWGCTCIRGGTLVEAAPVSVGHFSGGCTCVRGFIWGQFAVCRPLESCPLSDAGQGVWWGVCNVDQ